MVWKKTMRDSKSPRKHVQWLTVFLITFALTLNAMVLEPPPGDPQYKLRSFQLLANKNVHFNNSMLSEVSAKSKTDCGVKCVGLNCCTMFTFWPSGKTTSPGGTCRLHARAVWASSNNKTAHGARSYALSKTEFGLCSSSSYSSWCGYCFSLQGRNQTYNQATSRCAILQGKLVSPKTAKHIDSVTAFTQLTDSTCQAVWVGLRKEINDFMWTDGTLLPSTSPLWSPSHPIAGQDSGVSYDCAILRTDTARLDSVSCASNMNGVCVLCQPPN